MSINQAIIVGNLARDPEIKLINDKNKVKLVVATSAGDYPAEYTDVSIWVKNPVFYENLKKGNLVSVTGKVRYYSYENKNGQKVYGTEVEAKTVELVK